jgi:hypothetical protein
MAAPVPALRPVVAASWARSAALDPDRLPELELPEDEIADVRAAHPLAAVLPVVRRLLLDDARGSGLLVAIGDADGRLLWVEGDRDARDAAERMRFVAGAGWAEDRVGTSAPGTALRLDGPVQIRRSEHWSTLVKNWSCTAVPIHDTDTGRVLGVLDLTGDDRAVGQRTLPLLSATAVAMEAELALARLRRSGSAHDGDIGREARDTSAAPRTRSRHGSGLGGGRPRLDLLGADEARLHVGGRTIVLSARHSEILAVLAAAPAGLSAPALAAAVYDDADAVVTLRAELVRLRRVLDAQGGDLGPESRPYRFRTVPETDALDVLGLLDRGARMAALRAYRGPVLPGSSAPGVEAFRDRVRTRFHESVLEDGSVDALLAWVATADGADDEEALRAALALLPRRSPRRAGVVATLADLEESSRTSRP